MPPGLRILMTKMNPPNNHESFDWTQPISANRTYERNLPHLQNPGHLYYCTAVTHERRILTDGQRDIVMDSIHYLDGKHYDLWAAVMMPDHLHIVFRPTSDKDGNYISLSKIFHLLKGYTARKIGGHV